MKKLVLTTVCALAVAGVAFAQGTVNWSLISPAALTVQTNSQLYSPLFGGGSTGGGAKAATGSATTSGLHYYYELLYNTSFTGVQVAGASAPSNSFATLFGGTWQDALLTGTNSNTASFAAPINPNGAAAAPWANGVTNNIILVGWSANIGSSWASVSNIIANWLTLGQTVVGNGFFGVSAAGYINPNLAPAGGATLFNNAATANGLPINSLLTQLYLLPVPEPTTLALAGLGGLSLLLFRRRK